MKYSTVVGIALLLTGIGFMVLAVFGTLRLSAAASKPESLGAEAVVARTA